MSRNDSSTVESHLLGLGRIACFFMAKHVARASVVSYATLRCGLNSFFLFFGFVLKARLIHDNWSGLAFYMFHIVKGSKMNRLLAKKKPPLLLVIRRLKVSGSL